MIHILEVAASAGRSGGETYLLHLAKCLDRSRFSMEVLCPQEGPLVAELKKLNIPVGVLPLDGPMFLKAAFKLRDLIRHTRIDIVQSHGLRPNVLARLACLGTGIPVISTYHVSPAYSDIKLWKRTLYQLIDRWTRPLSSALLCVSQKLKHEITGKSDRCWTVIPNAVDTQLLNPRNYPKKQSKELLGLKRGEAILTLIGRLSYQKGHKILMEALKILTQKKLFPKVLFVGEGPMEEELRLLANKLKIDAQCFFLGSRTDIPQILAASDLIVVPSVNEGMPYAVLEAMAMEKPVLASAVDGIPEIIKDSVNGFLCRPGKPDILAQKIEALLKNRDKCRKAGLNARKTIKNQYDLEKWINSLQTLYQQIVDRGP